MRNYLVGVSPENADGLKSVNDFNCKGGKRAKKLYFRTDLLIQNFLIFMLLQFLVSKPPFTLQPKDLLY